MTTEKLEYNDPITRKELESALQKCQDKAPGEDKIQYSMLKNMSESAKLLLLFIYNQIYSKGVFPTSWTQSLLIPIAKPGKPEDIKSSYRPIALTSSLCKLLEKIINARLVHTLESSNFFSPYQYGFRKARSTIDPLTKIQTDIYRSFKNKCHTVAVFFDIQKAYDTTWKYHIIKTIYNAGIRGNMGIFIQNFLSNRTLKVKVNKSISNPFPQQQGVPQGSVMSVTLFGVAINGITDGISPDVCRSLFVDDLAIYFSSSSISTIERQLQLAIAKIQEFTHRTGFKISAEKTVAMHFHRKRGLQQEPDLNIGGTNIRFEQTAKFLGMIFDTRLYWHEHIKYLKNKCLKSLDILKCLSRMKWGADRQSLLHIYRATTRAQLDYGCQIYASAPTRYLQKLDAVHHQGIRICTGAFRSSPVPSLLAEASEMSLEDRRQQLIIQLFFRQQRIPELSPSVTTRDPSYDARFQENPHSKPFGTLARELIRLNNVPAPTIIPESVPSFSPWNLAKLSIHLVCNFNTTKRKADYPPQILKQIFMDHLQTAHRNTLHIYTDGSKSDTGVGLGVYREGASISKRVADSATNFTAELMAILEALKNVNVVQPWNITILTDSLSCIQEISNLYSPNPIVQNIQNMLLNIYNMRTVTFCWTPAHIDIEGNERADKLAKDATSVPQRSFEAVPYKDTYPDIKRQVGMKWEERWRTTPTSNKLRRIKDTTRKWVTCFPNRRRMEILICRLRIGHTRLTHGHYMERRATNDCPHCEETPLTVEHVLCECPLYDQSRRSNFQRYPTLRDILGKSLPLEPLTRFLQETETFREA